MTVPFDPVTGEVLELDTAQVRAVAAEYVSVLDAIRDGDRELRELQNHLARLADQLEFALGENGSVPAGDNVDVVCLRGTPGRRGVDRAVADEYREQLLTLGLGDVTNPEPVYIAPTLADVNRRKAEVIAAGVAWDRLVPEPRQPGLKINVVVK